MMMMVVATLIVDNVYLLRIVNKDHKDEQDYRHPFDVVLYDELFLICNDNQCNQLKKMKTNFNNNNKNSNYTYR